MLPRYYQLRINSKLFVKQKHYYIITYKYQDITHEPEKRLESYYGDEDGKLRLHIHFQNLPINIRNRMCKIFIKKCIHGRDLIV